MSIFNTLKLAFVSKKCYEADFKNQLAYFNVIPEFNVGFTLMRLVFRRKAKKIICQVN